MIDRTGAADEDALQALRKTVGDAAHTFNNLFAITLGRAEMLLDDSADPALRQECVESIRRAAVEGRELVQRLRFAAQACRGTRESRFG